MKIRSLTMASLAAAGMLAAVGPALNDDLIEARQPDPTPKPRRVRVSPRSVRHDRSIHMPHIGKKERARHAGKPDGPMHGLPPLFRAQPVSP